MHRYFDAFCFYVIQFTIYCVSSYYFDDEGTMAQDTMEIKDGILQTGIADAISAARLGITPTGNGKRESFKRKALT